MSIRLDETSFDLQGECPVCRGNNLEYDSADIDEDTVSYDWTCNDCKSQGTEWYTIEFYSQELKFDGEKNMSTDNPNREL